MSEHELGSDTLDGLRSLSNNIAAQSARTRRQIVEALLFWAGEKLVAMPISSPKPKQFLSYWPETVKNHFEAYGYNTTRLPRLGPDSREITHMDSILAWLRYIPERPVARLVALRILIHPVSQRHLNSWSACARIVGTDRQTAHRWFDRGISAVNFAIISTDVRALATELCVFDDGD